MYPADFFNLFPAFPRTDRTFVAMDFGEEFRPRWEHVLAPAIRSIVVNDIPQEPYRVDAGFIGDNILTEILTVVGSCRLVVADVTVIGDVERQRAGAAEGVPIRNANVLYEVGIAHTVRLPEEVLLFRSDDRPLMFDVAPIRVNRYDPDGNPAGALLQVKGTIEAALREIDLRRHLSVRRAASQMDQPCWVLLTEMILLKADEEARHVAVPGLVHPALRTMGNILGNASRVAAIARLLELGAIETRHAFAAPGVLDEEVFRYHVTPFGVAIVGFLKNEVGPLL